MGTTSLEGVAEASKGSPLLIFQLYVQRDRDFTASLLRSKLVSMLADEPVIARRHATRHQWHHPHITTVQMSLTACVSVCVCACGNKKKATLLF